MGTPFQSEIRIMSFNFAPMGWAQCNGQFLPINQNQALFSLLGTTYGGNGQTTFALPDLRGRVPIHTGGTHPVGEAAGQATHVLTTAELPTHTHQEQATKSVATTTTPGPAVHLAKSKGANLYAAATNLVGFAPDGLSSVGGSQAHENRQPYLALNFCIALQGIFPTS